jgi:hypothetical protein
MADLDDYELTRPATDAGLPPPRRPWIAIVVTAFAIAAAAWFLWPRGRPAETTPEVSEAAVPPKTSTVRVSEPGEDIELPPLGESDALVRELVSRLSAHPRVAAWLTTDDLIRDFAAIVVNISNGRTPAPHLQHVKPEGSFQVVKDGGGIQIDPRSYARYDGYAEAVRGIDARGAARLYATLKPRIEEAYAALGESGTVDRALEKAIIHLLQTPIVEGAVPLQSASVAYTFADPRLEGLTPVQRQFLRMGPGNMRAVQAKLREIAGFLGIPPESLPEERVVRARG